VTRSTVQLFQSSPKTPELLRRKNPMRLAPNRAAESPAESARLQNSKSEKSNLDDTDARTDPALKHAFLVLCKLYLVLRTHFWHLCKLPLLLHARIYGTSVNCPCSYAHISVTAFNYPCSYAHISGTSANCPCTYMHAFRAPL
jgi:hypothetical protein